MIGVGLFAIFAFLMNPLINYLGNENNIWVYRIIVILTFVPIIPMCLLIGKWANSNHQKALDYFERLARLRIETEAALRGKQAPPLPLEPYANLISLPKTDKVFWAGDAKMMTPKTRTVSTERVRVAKGVKVFGIRLSNNKYKTIRNTQRYLAVEGTGVLFVTDKKLIFFSRGQDKNWSKTWDSILSWEANADSIVVQLPSGSPKTFGLLKSGYDITQDASLCDMCMGLAKEL